MREFGAPHQISTSFASWLRYCSDVAQRRPTKRCTMFGRVLSWYIIYWFWGLLPANGISSGAKFTSRPSLAFSYIGSVTAWHSSSGRQPNFAAFSRGHHIYSAGRPSRWASAHILVPYFLSVRQIKQASSQFWAQNNHKIGGMACLAYAKVRHMRSFATVPATT